jgi:Uma2 family endonuclease
MSPRPTSASPLQIPHNPYIVPADVTLPREQWPTMYDLPSEDPEEPGKPDEFHSFQPQLLSATFRLTDVATDQIFTAADLNLYYDINHPRWYKRPDWFAVVGVPRFYSDDDDLRLSYVTWQEQVNPYLVVELLSPGTADEDLGIAPTTAPDVPPSKWRVYEQILRIPYYAVFNRYTGHLQAFRLRDGGYAPITILDGRFTIPELGIGLGLWHGEFQEFVRDWLRFFDADGQWILTPLEMAREQTDRERLRAEEARQRAEQEHQRAEQARQRAERLAEFLRSQGIDPDQV